MSREAESSTDGDLLVLAAPKSSEPYYRARCNGIMHFLMEYVEACVANGIDVVVLCDSKAKKRLDERVPPQCSVKCAMEDIWIRDYAASFPPSPVVFRYTATAQCGKQKDADFVQRAWKREMRKRGINYRSSHLILDGGNLVHNGVDKAVVTTRFATDNNLTVEAAREALRCELGIPYVSLVHSDDEEGLAHVDGMMMFVDEDTLIVNRYHGEFRAQLHKTLLADLPGIAIVEVVMGADDTDEPYDEHFASAMGIYTNSVVTASHVVVPVFGIAADDRACETISRATSKNVLRINAESVAAMGGSVRCLTWQLSGSHARTLKESLGLLG